MDVANLWNNMPTAVVRKRPQQTEGYIFVIRRAEISASTCLVRFTFFFSTYW
jgi:hypothetical protein